MTMVPIGGQGLLYPDPLTFYKRMGANTSAFTSMGGQTIDATGERAAFMGTWWWPGGEAGDTKTISSAGGKIHFRAGTVVNANAGTQVTVAIQDMSAAAGPPPRPDGTDDVSVAMNGAGAITSGNWNTATLSTGTKDLVWGADGAVVFRMEARGGSDSIQITTISDTRHWPTTNHWDGSVWAASSSLCPLIVLEADDGTLITFFAAMGSAWGGSMTWDDADNPDERGIWITLPFDVEVQGFQAITRQSGDGAELTFTLYSDPGGTPTVEATGVHSERHCVGTGSMLPIVGLFDQTAVLPAGDYVLAMKNADATDIAGFCYLLLRDAADRVLLPGGIDATMAYAARNNGAGAFSQTTNQIPMLGLILSAIDIPAGGGGGIARLAGKGLVN